MNNARKTVLVVDDERSIEQLIQKALERAGYTSISFSDPEEAYKYYVDKREFVCAVITDCTMPKLTGWDLARRIFDLDPDVPIIMITGLLEADVPEDLKHRLHRVIHKPFMKSEILEAVKLILAC